ncbi:MAG: EamA family transporter [Coriobacteriales bacterium]|nr:EamA family transporter [Coriobacteriales bacterium]
MIERKETEAKETKRSWLPYAIGSALFAALTAILGKVGITGVESNLGTAIRTGVVLVMAWMIVFVKGKGSELRRLDRKELVFIVLSGIATGASWLCYYYAIQNGVVSVVVPIDKLSIVASITFSYFVFGEKLSRRSLVGLILIVVATLAMAM